MIYLDGQDFRWQKTQVNNHGAITVNGGEESARTGCIYYKGMMMFPSPRITKFEILNADEITKDTVNNAIELFYAEDEDPTINLEGLKLKLWFEDGTTEVTALTNTVDGLLGDFNAGNVIPAVNKYYAILANESIQEFKIYFKAPSKIKGDYDTYTGTIDVADAGGTNQDGDLTTDGNTTGLFSYKKLHIEKDATGAGGFIFSTWRELGLYFKTGEDIIEQKLGYLYCCHDHETNGDTIIPITRDKVADLARRMSVTELTGTLTTQIKDSYTNTFSAINNKAPVYIFCWKYQEARVVDGVTRTGRFYFVSKKYFRFKDVMKYSSGKTSTLRERAYDERKINGFFYVQLTEETEKTVASSSYSSVTMSDDEYFIMWDAMTYAIDHGYITLED